MPIHSLQPTAGRHTVNPANYSLMAPNSFLGGQSILTWGLSFGLPFDGLLPSLATHTYRHLWHLLHISELQFSLHQQHRASGRPKGRCYPLCVLNVGLTLLWCTGHSSDFKLLEG